MSARPLCPRCGNPLSARASSAGDCPRCLVARLLAPPSDEAGPPADFGDYAFGAEIGRGGMGVVYRARQRSLDREVALKLLPFELLESEDFLERFEREARLMARLTHPGIARVFEAGISQRGQPFLALELVTGEPVTTFLRSHPLPLRARLELFLMICDAVQHAHQRGIIHRDLKPSNVLASEVDGDVAIKVIDFGLARPAGDHVADAALWRSQSAVVGTPLYMSPEQAGGGEVDTRTDIYSLGVLLCEMLAGAAPFAESTFTGSSRSEIARALRETVPRPPSEILAQHGGTAELPFRSAEMRGDLDAICLRAMSMDPAGRYPTVAALADDLRRHLAHEPVRAMRPTARYRLGKYARRHRILLGVSSLVVLGFAGATVFSTWQARTARLQRDRAERVKDFLIDVLGAPSPGADGREVRVIDVLTKAKERAESDDTIDPVVLADIRLTLGTTYYNLSLYDEAEPLLRHALADARRLTGDSSLATAEALKSMGELCNWTSRQADAAKYLAESVAIYRTHLPESTAALARALQSLASEEIHASRPAAAIPLLEESVRLAERAGGPGCVDALISMGDLATSLDKLGRIADARPVFAKVIPGMRANPALRENLPTMLSAQSDLLAESGDLPGAERVLAESVELRNQLYGSETTPVAVALGKLAWIRCRQGNFAGAESAARAGLAIQRKLVTPGAREYFFTLRPLAQTLLQTGRRSEAEPIFVELVEVTHRHMAADTVIVNQAEQGLAEARSGR
ncbi:hypothetical protein AYO41_04840 [Verrucomicrobia bacterium SCGC AG-212-E04]|nr:hypothetical protein AYO41_04840 [Verrucomicrobia bacterium SCGC AG-212-E04]